MIERNQFSAYCGLFSWIYIKLCKQIIRKKEPRKAWPVLRNGKINNYSLVEIRISTSVHYAICIIITTCFRIVSDHSSYDMIRTRRDYKIDLPSQLSLVLETAAAYSFLSFSSVFLPCLPVLLPCLMKHNSFFYACSKRMSRNQLIKM